MSYSFSTEPAALVDLGDAVKAAWDAHPAEMHTDEHEVLVAGQAAAAATFAAGFVPVAPADAKFRVSCSGHANPGFEERDGWALTHWSLSISEVRD